MGEDVLLVSLCGTHVGTLVRTRRGARFAYAEKIVREHAGQPLLSLSLPAKARPYAEGRTGSWFRGLLPEGKRLEAISRHIGCGEGDYHRILGHIAWECAGAVCITGEATKPPCGGAPSRLGDAELARRLRDLPAHGGLDPASRVSLAGYQDKLPVVGRDVFVRDGHVVHARWFEPNASSVSTHIIKPQPEGRHPGLVEAEAWAMGVAAHAARCAKTALLRLEDAPVSLVVERFDRTWRDGAFGNVDAHAKNYALLYRTLAVPELSPLYDVVPVVDVEPRAHHLSMRIGSAILIEDVGRVQILEVARCWGMEEGRAASVLDDTIMRLREGLARMRERFPAVALRHKPGAVRRIDGLAR